MSEANMQGQPSETKRPISNKPIALKAAVVARHIAGQSAYQINRELGISRSTVAVILSEPEFAMIIAECRSLCAQIMPKAVRALESQLEKGDGDLGLNFLEKMGVIGDISKPDVNINVGLALEGMPRMRILAQSTEADKPIAETVSVP